MEERTITRDRCVRGDGRAATGEFEKQINEASRVAAVIDFQNGTYVKLGPVAPESLAPELDSLLVAGERVHLAFKGLRDSVVFTDKRLISINVQGITGKKRDYTSLPLSKIQAWSVETAGTFDLDSELEHWFSV